MALSAEDDELDISDTFLSSSFAFLCASVCLLVFQFYETEQALSPDDSTQAWDQSRFLTSTVGQHVPMVQNTLTPFGLLTFR